MEEHIYQIIKNVTKTNWLMERTKREAIQVLYEHDIQQNREDLWRIGWIVYSKDSRNLQL